MGTCYRYVNKSVEVFNITFIHAKWLLPKILNWLTFLFNNKIGTANITLLIRTTVLVV